MREIASTGVAVGPVAQWSEPAAHNGLVGGSSPSRPTTYHRSTPKVCCPSQISLPHNRLPLHPMMTNPSPSQDADLIDHHGVSIRLGPSGLDWMALVAWPNRQPTLIMAPERETVLVKAREWIDQQLASDESPQ